MLGYFSLFKTYRNSSLASMHIFATIFGLYNATSSLSPVFDAYIFNKTQLNLKYSLEERDLPTGKLTQKEKQLFNEVTSAAYICDYFKWDDH